MTLFWYTAAKRLENTALNTLAIECIDNYFVDYLVDNYLAYK